MPINAIILAAGEGTRMKSSHPKVVHKLLSKPLIWWPVHAAREAGAERIIVVVGHGADEVRAALADETDIAGFNAFLARYKRALALEKTAVEVL